MAVVHNDTHTYEKFLKMGLGFVIPPWWVFSLLCVCFFCLYGYRFLSGWKRWNFACALAYYLDRSSPILEVKVTRDKKGAEHCQDPRGLHTNGMRSLQAPCSSSGRVHFLAAEGWRHAAMLVVDWVTHEAWCTKPRDWLGRKSSKWPIL